MVTVVFVPFPVPSKELINYFTEASDIADKFSIEIKGNFKEADGYIRFNLCVPHRMYRVEEVSADFEEKWVKFVKTGLSKELYNWLE